MYISTNVRGGWPVVLADVRYTLIQLRGRCYLHLFVTNSPRRAHTRGFNDAIIFTMQLPAHRNEQPAKAHVVLTMHFY